jgi:ubiquitin-protein ligase
MEACYYHQTGGCSEMSSGWRYPNAFLQIVLGVQALLNDPNVNDPAQSEAYTMFKWVLLFYCCLGNH